MPPQGNPVVTRPGARGLTPQQPIVETDRTPTNFFFRWLLDLTQANKGTVTSVGLDMPPEFQVAGSPITDAGTFEVTKTPELANTVWAGPVGGPPAPPTFRRLVPADIPGGTGGGPPAPTLTPWAEVPAGAQNDVNPVFTLSHTPVIDSAHIYRNGVEQDYSTGTGRNWITLSGNVVSFVVPPHADDELWAIYLY